ncbi:hypothetical protein DFH07DRAFT_781209 [Mycena maculata]|uniref:Uncharacterized protein n=1 Tax=Mycena maculata TaxID=230809 RepID=A0AAD7MT51_9AGAR|nr:hypothetical protein DFH07DRAFT_781209 [Mycena maculata]
MKSLQNDGKDMTPDRIEHMPPSFPKFIRKPSALRSPTYLLTMVSSRIFLRVHGGHVEYFLHVGRWTKGLSEFMQGPVGSDPPLEGKFKLRCLCNKILRQDPAVTTRLRKKVVDGVRSLMTDVNHLVASRLYGGHKPIAGHNPKGAPHLFDEILHLRLMADELQAAYYPTTLLSPTADNTPPTPTPLPAAPVEADTTKFTYTFAAKAATPPPAPGKPAMKPTTKP